MAVSAGGDGLLWVRSWGSGSRPPRRAPLPRTSPLVQRRARRLRRAPPKGRPPVRPSTMRDAGPAPRCRSPPSRACGVHRAVARWAPGRSTATRAVDGRSGSARRRELGERHADSRAGDDEPGQSAGADAAQPRPAHTAALSTRARTSSRDRRVGDAVQPLNLHAHRRRRAPLHKRRLLNNVGLKALVRAVPRGRSLLGRLQSSEQHNGPPRARRWSCGMGAARYQARLCRAETTAAGTSASIDRAMPRR